MIKFCKDNSLCFSVCKIKYNLYSYMIKSDTFYNFFQNNYFIFKMHKHIYKQYNLFFLSETF